MSALPVRHLHNHRKYSSSTTADSALVNISSRGIQTNVCSPLDNPRRLCLDKPCEPCIGSESGVVRGTPVDMAASGRAMRCVWFDITAQMLKNAAEVVQ